MSEARKRELVRGWCEGIGGTTFVASINENDRPPDLSPSSTWFTVVWEPDTVEPIGFCGVMQETGVLNVIVGGEPNMGDGAVAAASDTVKAALLAQVDPLDQLVLERANGTAEHSAGTADRWYRLNTPISYRYITGGP